MINRTPQATNRILNSASPLLRAIAELGIRINFSANNSYLELIHDQLCNEVRKLQLKLKQLGVELLQITATSYCLCSALDELIMNSKLCGNHDWPKKSLLSIVHNETWGGEHFYLILDYFSRDQRRNWEILELIQLLINFGYKGKLYASPESIKPSFENKKPRETTKLDEKNPLRNFKITLTKKPKITRKNLMISFYICLISSSLWMSSLYIYYNHKLEVKSQELFNGAKIR